MKLALAQNNAPLSLSLVHLAVFTWAIQIVCMQLQCDLSRHNALCSVNYDACSPDYGHKFGLYSPFCFLSTELCSANGVGHLRIQFYDYLLGTSVTDFSGIGI